MSVGIIDIPDEITRPHATRDDRQRSGGIHVGIDDLFLRSHDPERHGTVRQGLPAPPAAARQPGIACRGVRGKE